MNNKTQTITLGGGCFWCTEAIFEDLKGVLSVKPGYAGGTVVAPSYEQICQGNTGHAEVIQIEFNPKIISTEQILQIFFSIHDPTTLNQQGADTGSQYRSIILYSTPEQHLIAKTVIEKLNNDRYFDKPIVTETRPLTQFYPAEINHLDFYQNNPDQPYCQVVITPKVQKFRKQYQQLLKSYEK